MCRSGDNYGSWRSPPSLLVSWVELRVGCECFYSLSHHILNVIGIAVVWCVCLHMYDTVGAYVPGAHVVRVKNILAKRIEGLER